MPAWPAPVRRCLRRVLALAPVLERTSRHPKCLGQFDEVFRHGDGIARTGSHALKHRTFGTIEFAATLHSLNEVGKISIEQLLGDVRRYGVHA